MAERTGETRPERPVARIHAEALTGPHRPHPLVDSAAILALQRTAGNRAVTRALARSHPTTSGPAGARVTGAARRVSIQREEAPDNKGWIEKATRLLGDVKETAYSWMIEKLRGAQRAGLTKLRGLVRDWPPVRKEAAEAVIGGCEFITDLLISLLLAVAGLVAGLVSGLARLVWGLFKFLLGIVTTLLLFIAGFFGQQYRDEFDQRMREIGRAIANIGPALVGLKDRWIADWNKASTDRKSVMIGELTGEVEALLVSIWAGGEAASGIPKITVRLPEPALAVLAPGVLEGGAVTVAAGPPVAAAGLTGAMASSIDDAASGGTKTKEEPKAPAKEPDVRDTTAEEGPTPAQAAEARGAAAAAPRGGTLLQQAVRAGVRDEIDGPFEVVAHGTTREIAEKLIADQGEALSASGGKFSGQFHTVPDAEVARAFAARSATQAAGQQPAIVGIALPRGVMAQLRAQGLVRVEPIQGAPAGVSSSAQQWVFEPGALDAIKRDGFFFGVE